MSEYPILFSGPMVRAILEDRKTQTRRVVKFPKHTYTPDDAWVKSVYQDGGGNWIAWSCDAPDLPEFTKRAYPNGEGFPCPYGVPGDRLWVRETWAWTDSLKRAIAYRADGDKVLDWRPSIHMRREHSRLTLEVCEVRVQRVQEITTADIVAEGVVPDDRYLGSANRYRHAFVDLWDSINARRGYSWESNPWVWAITFLRVEP